MNVTRVIGQRMKRTGMICCVLMGMSIIVSACGGGGSGSSESTSASAPNPVPVLPGGTGHIEPQYSQAPVDKQPPWASPAVFVPYGQESIGIGISDCAFSTDASGPIDKPIYTPNLKFFATGDIVFAGGMSPDGEIKEIMRLDFKQIDYRRHIWHGAENNSLAVGYYSGFEFRSLNGTAVSTGFDGLIGQRLASLSQPLVLFQCKKVGLEIPLTVDPTADRLKKQFLQVGESPFIRVAKHAYPEAQRAVVWDSSSSLVYWDNLIGADLAPRPQDASHRYAAFDIFDGNLYTSQNLGPSTVLNRYDLVNVGSRSKGNSRFYEEEWILGGDMNTPVATLSVGIRSKSKTLDSEYVSNALAYDFRIAKHNDELDIHSTLFGIPK
jgi:hypothetical protein